MKKDETEPLLGQRAGLSKKGVIKDAVVVITLPWLVFFLVMCSFLFTYHDLAVLVWILVCCSIGLALLFLILGFSVKNRTFIAIGLLCMASTDIATTVGLWLNDSYLDRWYSLDYSGENEGVNPSIPPKRDDSSAVVTHFLNGSFVDDYRTVGYVMENDIWCVAPVSLPGFEDASVSYWATGKNCCEQRSGFMCGTSRDPNSNVAIATETEIYAEAAHFKRAVVMAQAVHGLESTEGYRLVSFVSSPQDVMGDLWDECVTIALFTSIMDIILCLAAGSLLVRFLLAKQQQQQQQQQQYDEPGAPFSG
eukprot:TRINITY_DN4779_c0_g1_i1.p1 TRINITY_DN4779_c0_g1~~TRINITY_DN4779_c0_g1_i1.p1  ORF type:complete len:307 (-),score=42.21 TRINITY_DN4779_c0_g1_i1:65-985(-)